MRPKLLDLFAGAGGVLGRFQPSRVRRHAIEFLDTWSDTFDFDAIHASPPCPRYSVATPDHKRDEHPDLIQPIRERLIELGLPYSIENVPGAPLHNPITLCGSMFGLQVRRHRLFESNVPMLQPACQHKGQQVYGVYGQHGDKQGAVARPNGTSRGTKARDVKHAQEVMGIEWMTEWSDLADAIPPAMTKYVGGFLMEAVEARTAA